jgi:hypothetical protein
MARGCKTWTGLLGNALFDAIEKRNLLMSWGYTEKTNRILFAGFESFYRAWLGWNRLWFDPSHAFCRCLVSYMDYRQTTTSIH